MQAIDGSLRRFGLDHIDLIYCHRPTRTRRSKRQRAR